MKYTDSHEWVSIDQGVGTVGISAYAQKELGEIVYVELPPVGKVIKAGGEAAVLESTKAAADVYSPISGQVVEVNSACSEKINQSPEGAGWLFKLKPSNILELEKLLTLEQYQQLIVKKS